MVAERSKTPPRLRVCLAATHPLATEYLVKLLEHKAQVQLFTDVKELTDHPASPGMSPVVIIDAYALPSPLGTCLRAVAWSFEHPRIIVTGSRLPDDDLCQLLLQGLRGYVVYEQASEQIGAAIDAVQKGHLWVPRAVLERYVTLSSALATPRQHGALSRRESEVVGLIRRRLTNKEIGDALGISERTVRFHLQNVFDKLGVRDRHSIPDLMRDISRVGPMDAAGAGQNADGKGFTKLRNLSVAA
jgi:DNA-binding NarL/FixJ family response regulator